MYNKTLWSPGDIITTSKWNNLTETTSFPLKIHKIPFTYESNGYAELDITPDDLVELLQKGYFCYFYDNSDQDELYLYFIGVAYEEQSSARSIDPENFFCYIYPEGEGSWSFEEVDNNKIIIHYQFDDSTIIN